jgi:hypothetical protein
VIKATGVSDGKPMLLLGLSGENVTRLMAGEPITFETAPMGLPPMVVVIMGGRTEGAIVDQLREVGLVSPGTTGRVAGG